MCLTYLGPSPRKRRCVFPNPDPQVHGNAPNNVMQPASGRLMSFIACLIPSVVVMSSFLSEADEPCGGVIVLAIAQQTVGAATELDQSRPALSHCWSASKVRPRRLFCSAEAGTNFTLLAGLFSPFLCFPYPSGLPTSPRTRKRIEVPTLSSSRTH